MKQTTIIVTMLLALVLTSCSEDTIEITETSQELKYVLADKKTNIGTYKGVFTTLDSEYRGVVEIIIEDFSLNYDSKSAHRATINLQTGDVIFATSKDFVNTDEATNNIHFSSPEISFYFSVSADGSKSVISNVVYNNVASSIITAKHTSKAPVLPVTGTFTCDTCNGYNGFNGSETFSLLFSGTGTGNETITTQVVFGGTNYNTGIGLQNNITTDGSFDRGDIASGDGVTNVGFQINGGDVIWYGNHTFDTAGINDCSRVNGYWSMATVSFGTVGGEFISDGDCTNPTVEVFNENFNAFQGNGYSPTPTAGQLDSNVFIVNGLSNGDLNYGDTGTSGDFARMTSTGGVSTGGIYAFDISNNGSGDWALGVQPGGSDFTPGYFEIKTTNNSGNTLTSFTISYDVYVFNDQPRANSMKFSYSTNGVDFINIPSLDYTSPETANPAPVQWDGVSRTADFFTYVPAGSNLYLRFSSDDVSGSGSRDEFAINNILLIEKD